MQRTNSVSETKSGLEKARVSGKRITFIPTMGALHEGHRSLFRLAKNHGDLRVVSIFVNPAQFNREEDFTNYPRSLEEDLKVCRGEGIDIVFCPATDEIYPDGVRSTIPVPKVGLPMEGEFRPGHFAGVCTVVDRLFQIVEPDTALFGEKDFQQLRVIEEMVREQGHRVKIVSGPTIRDENGLALSSRNRRLSPEGYQKALAIPRAIRSITHPLRHTTGGQASPSLILREGVKIDYFTIADPETLEPVKIPRRGSRVFVAAWVEGIRLIDNAPLI